MYKCQVTGKYSRQGDPRVGELVYLHETKGEDIHGSEKLNKIVVETRSVQYKHWDAEAEEEWFSYGTEIVREINASEEGLALWNSWSDEDRKLFVQGLS
jgi:hypothetical protein